MASAQRPSDPRRCNGGERGTFLIQGWTGMVMPHWNPEKVDHVEPIGDDEAVEMTRRLAQEGIFAGISTGRTSSALIGWGAPRPGRLIVTLAVDTGFKDMG